MTTTAQEPKIYLLTGYYASTNKETRVGDVKLSSYVDILPRQLVYMQPIGTTFDKDRPHFAISDNSGVLYKPNALKEGESLAFNTSNTWHEDAKALIERNITIIPPGPAAFAIKHMDRDWQKTLTAYLEQYGKGLSEVQADNKLKLYKVALEKKNANGGPVMRKPLDKTSDIQEIAYHDWWEKNRNIRTHILGYIIPRTRAIVLTLSKKIPIVNAPSEKESENNRGSKKKEKFFNITMRTPGSTYIHKLEWLEDDSYSHYICVFNDSPALLPNGYYQFSISLDSKKIDSSNKWSTNVSKGGYNGSSYEYTLGTYANFKMNNIAGEFEVVCLDPITLEESLVQQFPRYFSHLLQAAHAKHVGQVPGLSALGPPEKPDSGANASESNLAQTLEEQKSEAINEQRAATSDKALAETILKQEAKLAKQVAESLSGLPSTSVDSFADQWSRTKTATELAQGILTSADISASVGDKKVTVSQRNKVFITVAKALHDHFEKEENEQVKKMLDLGFSSIEGLSAWDSFVQTQARHSAGRLTGIQGFLRNNFTLSPSSQNFLEDFEGSFANKLGIPPRMADLFGRAAKVGVATDSAVKLSLNLHTFFSETLPDAKQSVEDYGAVAKDYYTTARELNTKDDAFVDIKVHFALDSSELNASAIAIINEAAPKIQTLLDSEIAQGNESVLLEIQGHTCDLGGFHYNSDLSHNRAKAVFDCLSKTIDPNKMSFKGYAYLQPLKENINEANRAANRRTRATLFTIDHRRACPSREAIGNLELYRTQSVNLRLKVDKAQFDAAVQALGFALSTLAIVPRTAIIAGAILLAGDASTVVKNAVLFIDDLILGSTISDWVETRSNGRLLSNEIAANWNQMNELLRSFDGDSLPHDQEWAVQYRLRSDVIAGLVRLLLRAGLGASSTDEYHKRVNDLKIGLYINTFLLNDGWTYPLQSVGFSVDQYWTFVMAGDSSRDLLGLDWNITKEWAKDQVETLGIPGGLYYLARQINKPEGHILARFHQYAPIHRMASQSIQSFANTFHPDPSHLDRSSYARTAVYVFDEDEQQWTMADGRHDIGRGTTVYTPLSKIRVLIVFKQGKDGIESPFRLGLQLMRADGINVEGPIYKGIALPLQKEELAELAGKETRYTGYMGCIFEPFYQIGLKTYQGLKPMAYETGIDLAGGPKKYYEKGNLTNMDYFFKCWVGAGEANKRNAEIDVPVDSIIHLGRVSSRFGTGDEITVSLPDSLVMLEGGFLNKDFLVSRSSQYTVGKLFEKRLFANPLISIGNRPFISADRSFDHLIGETALQSNIYHEVRRDEEVLYIDDFDWKTPVKIAMSCTSLNLLTDSFTEPSTITDRHWKRINGSAQMVEYDSISANTDGPTIPLRMTYVGKVQLRILEDIRFGPNDIYASITLSATLIPEHDMAHEFNFTSDQLLYLIGLRQFRKSGFFDLRVEDAVEDFDKMLNDGLHLHIGVWNSHYISPKGVEVKSLRPFGAEMNSKGEFSKYLKYMLDGFTTEGKSGFNKKDISEYKFCFASPKNVKTGPWTKPVTQKELDQLPEKERKEREKQAEMTIEEMEKWLTDDSETLRQPKSPLAFDKD